MTKPVDPEKRAPEDTPIEGTVFTPRQVGILKAIVVVLGVLLLAALAAVIVGMIFQASKIGKKSAASDPAAAVASEPIAMEAKDFGMPHALNLPRDAKIFSMSLDGHRLALHVRSRDSAEIVIVDMRSGKVISRLKIEASLEP